VAAARGPGPRLWTTASVPLSKPAHGRDHVTEQPLAAITGPETTGPENATLASLRSRCQSRSHDWAASGRNHWIMIGA
jgi:hypothetical protein